MKYLLLALALLAGGWLLFRSSREPKYRGKTLDHWFNAYADYNSVDHPDSLEALRQFGADAVPFLVRQALTTNVDSRFRGRFIGFMNNLPRQWGLPRPLSMEAGQAQAAVALHEIKPAAELLLPLLKPALQSTNLLERQYTLDLLGAAGTGSEKAVPDLQAALADPDSDSQRIALYSLWRIGPAARTAMPALMNILNSSNRPYYQIQLAAKTLGKIGPDAAPAVPKLGEMFTNSTVWSQKTYFAAALLQIEPDQPEALSFLTNGLCPPHSRIERCQAATALGLVGPPARAAIPALLDSLAMTNGLGQNDLVSLLDADFGALNALGVPQKTLLPLMKNQMRAGSHGRRWQMANKILTMDPSDHDACLTLIDLIQKRSSYQTLAMDTLRNAGPAAQEAIPALREALKNDDPTVRKAAAAALKKIESKAPAK